MELQRQDSLSIKQMHVTDLDEFQLEDRIFVLAGTRRTETLTEDLVGQHLATWPMGQIARFNVSIIELSHRGVSSLETL